MSRQKQAGDGQGKPGAARAVLIDDQLVFRLGLRMYLAGAMEEVEWAGEAASVAAGLDLVERVQADLVLLDSCLGDHDIGEVLRQLREKRPECRVVVLANLPDSRNLAQAAEAGANGYLLKTLPPEEMVGALREVLRGATWIQPELAQQLYAEFARGAAISEALSLKDVELTLRQLEVLTLIAQGLRNSEIAARLVISEQTVKTHVAHLLEKLGVSSRLQAARYAISKKLVDA